MPTSAIAVDVRYRGYSLEGVSTFYLPLTAPAVVALVDERLAILGRHDVVLSVAQYKRILGPRR
jgi:hypothetical protein